MSDSFLHDRSDDIGYAGPALMAIAMHLLPACALWISAPHPIAGENVMAKQAGATSPSVGVPLASGKTGAGGLASQANASRADGPAAVDSSVASVSASLLASGKRVVPASGKSPRIQQAQIKTSAKPRGENPPQRKSQLAQAVQRKKAEPPAVRGNTRGDAIRTAKSRPAKQAGNMSDVADQKKLERLREAELRQISANLS